jgi:predicted Zn-dependent peptidase
MTGGMSLTDPRRYALSLLSTILGGNMSSRLFQEIRERQGLAYSIYSFFSSFMDTGMFGVYTGVEPKKARLAAELILREMMRLKTEPVHADELSDAKEYTKGSLMLAAESVDNQMVRIAQNEANFGEYIPLKAVMAGIDAVTPEDLAHLAADIFLTDRIALVLLGPLKNKKAFESVLLP